MDCQFAALDAGTSIEIEIELRVDAAGSIRHDVNVSLDNFDPNTSDNSATETTTVN